VAAPLTKRQRTGHIDSIQTSKLINKLEHHALEGTEMSQSQVHAAMGLLKKTLPDLKATELDVGQGELTVNLNYASNKPA
jgi:hypothetical protein